VAVVSAVRNLTLAEQLQLLADFDPMTGSRRPRRVRGGSPFVAMSAALLVDLLAIGAITLSGEGQEPYAAGLVYPTTNAVDDPLLAAAAKAIGAQRKVRTARWYLARIVGSVDLFGALLAKGMLVPDGRNYAMTEPARQIVSDLLSGPPGDRGGYLAALVVRGDLIDAIYPDASATTIDWLRDRSIAAPIAARQIFQALESANTPTVG
jgi:hypothetical protein